MNHEALPTAEDGYELLDSAEKVLAAHEDGRVVECIPPGSSYQWAQTFMDKPAVIADDLAAGWKYRAPKPAEPAEGRPVGGEAWEIAMQKNGGRLAVFERESANLLPCPFCGSAQVSLSEGETGDGQPWPYVECEECAATATPENWNTRTTPTAERPQVEPLMQHTLRKMGAQLQTDAQHFDGEARSYIEGIGRVISGLAALAAPPAAGQASAVRELVAKWREEGAYMRRLSSSATKAEDSGWFGGSANCADRHADELERLADAAPVDREQDERECCPVCHETDRITSTRVPEHRREYVVHGEECTDHMPAMRDCHCLNCDAKWIMPESQDDFR